MSGGERPRLTLEERLELAARSRASSPEAAVELVRRFSRLPASRLFHGRDDMNAMYGLTGEFWDCPATDLYGDFCLTFWLAAARDNEVFPPPGLAAKDGNPYRPIWGTRFNNAIILLGLMLLDHMKNRMACKDIYHCTRMTLGQYLDALGELGPRQDGKTERRRWDWTDLFLRYYDGSTPLADVLEGIVKGYIAAWRTFGHIDRILDGQAGESPVDVPDPCSAAPGTVRKQIFLKDRDYSPAALRELAAGSPSPELHALLEGTACEEWLADAMLEVNMAVSKLFLLWVEPYLRL